MRGETIEKAVELGSRLGHAFVATADADGLPHIAASTKLGLTCFSFSACCASLFIRPITRSMSLCSIIKGPMGIILRDPSFLGFLQK
ncbi:MAG: hypothetical protein R6V46_12450 [Desulfatiglandaceae bacterium]